jgi:hypothetical protein
MCEPKPWRLALAMLATLMLAGGIPAQPGEAECPNSCTDGLCEFYGISNAPLGNASLSIKDDCNLQVNDIGGSGIDGVVQLSLESKFMASTLGTPNFSASIIGTQAEIRQLGIAGGESGSEIMATRLVNFDNARVRHVIDCSEILVESYSISIYLEDQLVHSEDLGINPPVLLYPKTDLLWIACGIFPNGDAYTVFELGSSQEISLFSSPNDPGPYVGNMVFVVALSPELVPTEQESIETTFFNTGPVMTMTAMAALPEPCPPDEVGEIRLSNDGSTLVDFDSLDHLTGPTTPYEVVTGLLSGLHAVEDFTGVSCLGFFPDPPAEDLQVDPPAGDGYYYVVRGRRICPLPGPGTFGDSSFEPDPRDDLDSATVCGALGRSASRKRIRPDSIRIHLP